LHFDGERWERHAVAAPEGLTDVWAGAANDVWAVGSAGLVYHYDGDQWTRFESETDAGFSTAFGVAQNDVWLAGDGGTLLHFDGGDLTVSTDIEETTATGNFSGGPTLGTFLLTTRYGNSGPERQDVWTYDNDTWHSIFHNANASDFMSNVAVTPEGELWVAGDSLIRLR
jgi:photosystem II stability/assembly factor-like uncharacterized protein